jgi:hypothetical protein
VSTRSGDEDEKEDSAAGSQGTARAPRHGRGPGRPFKKGQSGNPKGRTPVLADIRTHFMPHVESVLNKLLVMALKERGAVAVAAAREFLDRVTGKAPQPIVGEDGGAPINIDSPALVEALRRYIVDKDDNVE